MKDNEVGGEEEGAEPWQKRFAMMDHAALKELPPLKWLVDGFIPARGMTFLLGPPKVGKSFVALDLAGCIARGVRWHGREVVKAPVAYLALEGTFGMSERVTAWEEHWGPIPPDGLRFLDPAALPNLSKIEDVADLAAAIRAQHPTLPRLLILDTLSRAIPGIEENSAGPMSLVMENLELLASKVGAALLVVHHVPKSATRTARGSGVQDAALVGKLVVQEDGDGLEVRARDNRFAEDSAPIRLHIVSTDAGPVLLPHEGPVPSSATAVPRSEVELLALLAEASAFTSAEWKDVADMKPRTFYRGRKALQDRGFVVEERGKWTLTVAGSDACANLCQAVPFGTTAQRTPPSATSSTTLGVGSGTRSGASKIAA